ncbi:MAG: histidine triad nucleotide-binding protein [Zhaonellaceae bacterium]|jgi:histidine triad (HIT) family protein|nr:histidine triad nucleotide-binding protein [Clostridia bacterium]
MSDCLFCKIVQKEVPSEIIYEDDQVIAFKDISPVAPVHVLIVPKKHIPDLTSVEPEDANLMGHIVMTAKNLAIKLGVDESGFRLINNCKQHGGQVIYHIHFHLIGGRQLSNKC